MTSKNWRATKQTVTHFSVKVHQNWSKPSTSWCKMNFTEQKHNILDPWMIVAVAPAVASCIHRIAALVEKLLWKAQTAYPKMLKRKEKQLHEKDAKTPRAAPLLCLNFRWKQKSFHDKDSIDKICDRIYPYMIWIAAAGSWVIGVHRRLRRTPQWHTDIER